MECPRLKEGNAMFGRRRLVCGRSSGGIDLGSDAQVHRYFVLRFLLVCTMPICVLQSQGQTQPNPSASASPGKACDGITPAPAGGFHTGEQAFPSEAERDGQASRTEADGAADRLRLSVKSDSGTDAAEAARLLCKREKPSPPCQASDVVPCRVPKAPVQVSENDPEPLPPQAAIAPSSPDTNPRQAVTAESPAVTAPSVVQFSDGKLTIRASGQEFAAVLAAVSAATGVKTDIPPGAGSDPVFMSIGPAPVREVLTALLTGSRYNYILLGSRSDGRQVTRVIVSLQPPSDKPPVAVAGGPPHPAAADPDDNLPEINVSGVPLQPSVIQASVPKVDVQQLAAREGKTTGEVLDELQKKQLEVLDTQSTSPDPISTPPQ
jgi:hypothetical protein